MDQHEEKEENKFQESPDQQRKQEAAAEEEDNSEQSIEEREGDKAGKNSEESAGQLKEAAAVEECVSVDEASPLVGIFAHPCSLLQYLLRACAGCWGLHDGAFSDGPEPAAAVAAPDAAAAPANSSSQGGGEGGGGEKANYFYMQGVVARVWVVRRPRPPDRPREGNGGNGGIHH